MAAQGCCFCGTTVGVLLLSPRSGRLWCKDEDACRRRRDKQIKEAKASS